MSLLSAAVNVRGREERGKEEGREKKKTPKEVTAIPVGVDKKSKKKTNGGRGGVKSVGQGWAGSAQDQFDHCRIHVLFRIITTDQVTVLGSVLSGQGAKAVHVVES